MAAASALVVCGALAVLTHSQTLTIECASSICNVTGEILNSTTNIVCAASVDLCLIECHTNCNNLTIASSATHTIVQCVSPDSCRGVRLICDDNVHACDMLSPSMSTTTTNTNTAESSFVDSTGTAHSGSFVGMMLDSKWQWFLVGGILCIVLLVFCIGVFFMYRAKRSHRACKNGKADTVARHVALNVIPAAPENDGDDDDDDDEDEHDAHAKQLRKPRSTSYLIRQYLTAQNVDTGVDDDVVSPINRTSAHSTAHSHYQQQHQPTDLASSVNMFSAAVQKQLTLSQSKQRGLDTAATTTQSQSDEDREDNEPELPSRAQQKSTFDATLDDVVTANTSLMDEVVREVALSLSRRETPALSAATAAVSRNHASQRSLRDKEETTADAPLSDTDSDRMKIYGFSVANTVLETVHTSEEFIPPPPEAVFPSLKVTFDRKLNNAQHSQQIMMDHILDEIVKKEAQFTAK